MTVVRSLPREFPLLPPAVPDTLWFQVAGTVCNVTCTHCFISCSPSNRTHEMLPLAAVLPRLEEAERLGVRDYYFTGGEPFLNPDLPAILDATLRQGAATVLTNGMLVRAETARALRALSDGSRYSLDVRVSFDGTTSSANDAIRGEGSFERALAGVRALVAAGLDPVLTFTEVCEEAASARGRARLLEFCAEAGLRRPRLKTIPTLRIGAEAGRARGYTPWETLRGAALSAAETDALQCSSSRLVSSRGVYVCPILLDAPDALLGRTVEESLVPFELRHAACFTCHATGLTCRT